MRIDLISIFPQYFSVLDLSLMGKARTSGQLDIRVHDLREWTHDRHRSVDDTPYGGGAGMVMKPDVWGEALDDIIADSTNCVLAIPTPSGVPFSQKKAQELAGFDRIIVACGRYEGIDQRVGDHYRSRGLVVEEFSIGDYVLNGGEVAALVLVEAVGRLLDGVIGNPDSLVEESHSGIGLLEYPVYTKPQSWRGLDVPSVLMSGDHAKIERWRSDRSLERTTRRRPDIMSRIEPQELSTRDREVIAAHGLLVCDDGLRRVEIRRARKEEAEAISELASRTFPLAVPDMIPSEAAQDFIRTGLTPEVFARYLADEQARCFVACSGGSLIAYSLVFLNAPADMPRGNGKYPLDEHAAYLSKCYADLDVHGSGIAGALLEHTIDAVRQEGATQIVLGTHIYNERAQRFYRKHGFKKAGRRHFRLNDQVDASDVVMVRPEGV